jgi:hypothetical protein
VLMITSVIQQYNQQMHLVLVHAQQLLLNQKNNQHKKVLEVVVQDVVATKF